LKRFEGIPILEPRGNHSWESRLVFNAAAILLNKQVHLLYRAMGNDHISRIGYATSSDGYNIDERLPEPILAPIQEEEKEGCEDPRITLIDDRLHLVYTAFGQHERDKVFQIAHTSISAENFLAKQWQWEKRSLPFAGIRNKNGLLLPKKIDGQYLMFNRFDPDLCIAKSTDLQNWCDLKYVMGPRQKSWDSWKIGTTGPPIELNEGWLFIYHGVDYEKVYRLGVAMLDKQNLQEVIYRCKDPILWPERQYERFGDVPNVVYSCGSVRIDNQVLIYYGGADSVLNVATYDLAELLPKK
jgi:predicted GH43/DUF377 family glycosyl hydrolase